MPSAQVVTIDYLGQPLTFRYQGWATLGANRRLTDDEYLTACRLADRVAELKSAGGLPAAAGAIGEGANAWSGILAGGWNPLFAKDRRHFDCLRLFCQPFTGFDQIDNSPGGTARTVLPDDAEDLLRRHQGVFHGSVLMLADHRRLPDVAKIRLPLVFGEVGPVGNGMVLSYDAWCLQMEMNGLFGSGVIGYLQGQAARASRVTVADIGSGFGGLAFQIGRTQPAGAFRFVAIDLPDSLLFAAIYLTTLWKDRPTYLAVPEGYLSTRTWTIIPRLPDDFAAVFVVTKLAERVLRELMPLDLIVNFRSMQEMSDAQVEEYGALARATLGERGLLYEQNAITRGTDRDVKAILGGIMPFGGLIEDTDPSHRDHGLVSLWSNQPIRLVRPATP